MACLLLQGGATALLLPKKRREGTLAAARSGVRGLGAVFLETSTADVLEGLARFVFIFVSALLWAIFVVEINTDLILTHKELGNTVDVLLSLLLLAGLVVGRSSRVLLELLPVRVRVRLRDLRESGPNVLQP